MIKTIILDLGGVFLNRGIWKFWDYAGDRFGIGFEKAKDSFLKYYKEYFSGKISEEMFWKDYLSEIGIKEDWRKLKEILLDFFEPNEGMIELCKELRTNGIKLILLSDQTREWWPFLNDKFKIDSYFDSTIVSALVGVHKPDPKIYQMAVEVSGMKPEECIFVDDLEHNLEPAEKIGMKTIFFKDPKQLRGDLIRIGLIN
ncbi:MAG TPA: HAD family phosphatase [Patescibacteria group bacterium]|nr:HAD family phosphatase [Patescibacteria group bacterium]